VELILENWRGYLKEEKEKQLIEEGWKDWVLATVIGASSIFGSAAQAYAAPMPSLDTIELSSSALKSGEDPTALRKRIVRSKRKRARIMAKELDRLLKTDYFKPLKALAEKHDKLRRDLFTYASYAVENPDVNEGKRILAGYLDSAQNVWTRGYTREGKTK
tara:strand:+ start:706 stop:1188 length:483 start_codon:yes stop_codon:yes gene_type:complete